MNAGVFHSTRLLPGLGTTCYDDARITFVLLMASALSIHPGSGHSGQKNASRIWGHFACIINANAAAKGLPAAVSGTTSDRAGARRTTDRAVIELYCQKLATAPIKARQSVGAAPSQCTGSGLHSPRGPELCRGGAALISGAGFVPRRSALSRGRERWS